MDPERYQIVKYRCASTAARTTSITRLSHSEVITANDTQSTISTEQFTNTATKGRHSKLTFDDADFDSPEEEKRWREKSEEFAKYYEENYNEDGERIDETKDYIDDLIEEHHFKTLSDTEEIWRYDQRKGIYVPNGECMIKARIEKDHKDKVTNKFVNEQIG